MKPQIDATQFGSITLGGALFVWSVNHRLPSRPAANS